MPVLDSITRSSVIPASPEEVWDALVEPDRLAEWLAEVVELDDEQLAEGAEITLRFQDGSERRALLRTVRPPRRLAFTWRSADEATGDDDETDVTFALDPVPEGTLVTVIERGFALLSPEARQLRTAEAAGWGPRLSALGSAAGSLVAA